MNLRPFQLDLLKSGSLAALVLCLTPQVTLAQSITAAPDDTGTAIVIDGNTYNISGGTQAGANLFHSFQQFGLSANEMASFLANPQIQNILGRVVSGDPSIINGLIQVTGGNPNLYIMNPAGMIFGPGASLDVPGSFFATTSDRIEFDGGAFNSFGDNNYQTLVGSPTSFVFASNDPGSIVNAGTLSVGEGQTLSLVGGEVIQTGEITTAGGTITLAAVPGTSRVRISQEGMLLSLEVDLQDVGDSGITPLDLPSLLTGQTDLGVTVGGNNSVIFTHTNSEIPTTPGTAIASGTLDVSNLNAGGTGGNLDIFGTTVGLLGANLNASGAAGGGNIRVGGDAKGQGTVPNADVLYSSADSTINADATTNGDGGNVILWSNQTSRIYSPISVRGGVTGGNGGFVETSSAGFLDVTATPDLTAPAGTAGEWLIDPHNITIGNYGGTTTGVSLPDFTATADNAQIDITTLLNALTGGATVTVSTGTTGTQAGNITLATNLDYNGRGANTLRLEAANTININAQIFDSDTATTPNDSLNLVLIGNSDGVGSGPVYTRGAIFTGGGNLIIQGDGGTADGIGTRQTIDTGGGDITFTGTTDSGFAPIRSDGPINSRGGNITWTGTNTGTNANNWGVVVNGTLNSEGGNIRIVGQTGGRLGVATFRDINSGTGNLTIEGTSTGRPGLGFVRGINLQGAVVTNGGDINLTGSSTDWQGIFAYRPIQSNGGNITINATSTNTESLLTIRTGSIESGGGNITINGSSQNSRGLRFQRPINSNGGNISLTGTSINREGIQVLNTLNSNGGNVNLTGISTNRDGIQVFNVLNAGSGDITLSADRTRLDFGNTAISGTGTLLIQPLTTNLDLTVGGTGAASTTFLNNAELNNITPGFSAFTIGHADGTGTTVLGSDTSFNQAQLVTVRNGNIDTNGFNLSGNAALTLQAVNTITVSNNLSSVGDLTLIGDEIDLNGGANSVSGNSALFLRPATVSRDIEIGNATNSPTALSLTTTDLGALQDGFSQINIGYAASTGTVTLNRAATFNDGVQILGGSTLVGPDRSTVWNLTGTDAGNLSGYPNSLSFSNIENLTGGNASDTFRFVGTANLSGNIDGVGVTDILDYSAYTGGDLTIKLGTTTLGTATAVGGRIFSIEGAIANTAFNNTLIGEDIANNWQITGNNSGTVNDSFTFANFQNLVGGAVEDTFNLQNGGAIASMDGSTGNDAFVLNSGSTAGTLNGGVGNDSFTLNGGNAGTLNGGVGNDTFTLNNGSRVTTVNAGAGDDTFTFNSGSNAGTVNGGFGNDIFTLNNGSRVTTANAGVGDDTFKITGRVTADNLNGDTGNDTFQFIGDTPSITGSIDGGPDFDTLDYRFYFGQTAIVIPGSTRLGTATGVGGTIIRIENFLGNFTFGTDLAPPRETPLEPLSVSCSVREVKVKDEQERAEMSRVSRPDSARQVDDHWYEQCKPPSATEPEREP